MPSALVRGDASSLYDFILIQILEANLQDGVALPARSLEISPLDKFASLAARGLAGLGADTDKNSVLKHV